MNPRFITFEGIDGQAQAPDFIEGDERRRGIGTASAEPALHRNPFLEPDVGAPGTSARCLETARGAQAQVVRRRHFNRPRNAPENWRQPSVSAARE